MLATEVSILDRRDTWLHKHDWLGSLCSKIVDTVVADNDVHTRLAFAIRSVFVLQ